ncbi:MAG: hypothetical protein KDC44_15965 [Phaeodactylibacter sp.]|nr:hypothetical protein [Phaeodactylibacter sp.]
MEDLKIIDERIVQVVDILEQIKSVDGLIELHEQKDESTDLMLQQYKYRRDKFLKELGGLLEAINIRLDDLAE